MTVPVGIDNLRLYFPPYLVRASQLATQRKIAVEKITKGLGIKSFCVNDICQDTVTMAAEAAFELLESERIDVANIGRVVVATESEVDMSKPVAGFLVGLLGLSSECQAFDIKFACASGSFAIEDSLRWLQAQKKDAMCLVIATDIARYAPNGSAEFTQGAGAAALLLTQNPKFLVLDPDRIVTYCVDQDDFFRPLRLPYAVVRGKKSVQCYLHGLRVIDAFRSGFGSPTDTSLADFFVCHIPYPRLVSKALDRLSHLLPSDMLRVCLEYSLASTRLASICGNMYTASIFAGLSSLCAQLHKDKVHFLGKRVGLYFYGSGSCSRFMLAEFAAQANQVADQLSQHLSNLLDSTIYIEPSQYESLRSRWESEPRMGEHLTSPLPCPPKKLRFFFAGTDETGYPRYCKAVQQSRVVNNDFTNGFDT